MFDRSISSLLMWLIFAYDFSFAMITAAVSRVSTGNWWGNLFGGEVYYFPFYAFYAFWPSVIYGLAMSKLYSKGDIPHLRRLIAWSFSSSLIVFLVTDVALNTMAGTFGDRQYNLSLLIMLPGFLLSGLICGFLANRLNRTWVRQ